MQVPVTFYIALTLVILPTTFHTSQYYLSQSNDFKYYQLSVKEMSVSQEPLLPQVFFSLLEETNPDSDADPKESCNYSIFQENHVYRFLSLYNEDNETGKTRQGDVPPKVHLLLLLWYQKSNWKNKCHIKAPGFNMHLYRPLLLKCSFLLRELILL